MRYGENLKFMDTDWGVDEMGKLAKTIPHFVNLKALVLASIHRSNPIADAGTNLIADCFQFTPFLAELILQRCSITDDGAGAIGDKLIQGVLPDFTTLDLAYNPLGDGPGAKTLGKVVGLGTMKSFRTGDR